MSEALLGAPAVALTERRHLRDHYGALRAVGAIPSICSSVLVLAMAFGWAGPWANLVLAGWLTVGLALMSRPAEHVGVAVVLGYRRFTAREASLMHTACRRAVDRCGVSADAIDFYLRRRSRGVNAWAAGARSVAVSARRGVR